MSSSSLLRTSRRLSLAPTQAKDAGLGLGEEEGASLLMEMSLTELRKKSPVKAKRGRRTEINEDDLDKLSQEELELLAWEAMEEENRLQSRRSSRRYSNSTTEEPMKNITVRQKSSTPRKKATEQKQKGQTDAEVDNKDCFAPLLKSTSTSPVKHSYDRQASPSRSALRQPHIRKSVAFGEVAEYEISAEEVDLGATSSDVLEGAIASSSSSQTVSSRVESSSPLSRFNGGKAPLPIAKAVFKGNKDNKVQGRTSLRVKEARLSDGAGSPSGSHAVKKTTSKLSPKSPIAKTRLREAIQASSAKARIKARASAVKAKAKAKTEVKVPNGFRMSSTGTLVAQTKCTPFSVAVVKPSLRGEKASAIVAAPSASKANPVPEWLKRRKDTLMKEGDARMQKEIERVRAQELAVGQGEEKEKEQKKSRRPAAVVPAYTSAVEKRIAERAAWEAKRKVNESILQEEKEKARQQREEREEQEYRLARQRTVVKANPVPDFIRARAGK